MAKRRSYNLRLPCCRQRGMLCRAAAGPHISRLFLNFFFLRNKMCSEWIQITIYSAGSVLGTEGHIPQLIYSLETTALHLKIQLKHHMLAVSVCGHVQSHNRAFQFIEKSIQPYFSHSNLFSIIQDCWNK